MHVNVNFYRAVKMSLALTMHALTVFASDCDLKVLMGNFNCPNIYRRDNAAGRRQSWRFLAYINFFTQVTEELVRRGAHWTSYSPTRRGSLVK